MTSYVEFGDKKVELSSNFNDVLGSFRRVRKLIRYKRGIGNLADQVVNDLTCIHSCVSELSEVIIKSRIRHVGDTESPRWPMTDLVINGKSVTGKDRVWEINKTEHLSLISPNATARFTTKLTVNNYAHGVPDLDVRIASGRSIRFWMPLHNDITIPDGRRIKDIMVDENFAMYDSHHRPTNSHGPVHSSYTLIDLCDLKSALSGLGDYYLKRHLSPSEYLIYRLNYG